MNQHLAALVTLLVTSVSGFAIWQAEVQAATVAETGPVTAAAAPTIVVPTHGATVASPRTLLERLLRGELTVDVRAGERSLTLHFAWREPAPLVAAEHR